MINNHSNPSQQDPASFSVMHADLVESYLKHKKEAFFVIDPQSHLVYKNEAGSEFLKTVLGIQHDSLKDIFQQIPSERVGRITEHLKSAFAGNTTEYEIDYTHPRTNEVRWISGCFFPLGRNDHGNIASIGLELKDITEIKVVELKYQQIYHEKSKEFNNAVLSDIEEQRRKIAFELHENVNQSLAAAKLMLDMIPIHTEVESEYTEKMRKILYNAVNGVNKICSEICPDMLTLVSLSCLIDDLAIRFNKEEHLTIRVNKEHYNSDGVGKEIELTLLRVIQEVFHQLSNSRERQTIDLLLEQLNGHAILHIVTTDSQINLYEFVKSSSIVGLINRCHHFDGTFQVERKQDGVHLKATLPLKQLSHGVAS